MAVLLESHRSFQLWRAVAGHRQVLLRSTKENSEQTRVDLLFKPVEAMKLRTVLDGIVVRDAEPPEADRIAAELGQEISDGFNCYVVESHLFVGWVVSMTFASAEDDGEYDDPSQFPIE